jgi:hypothetical protein
VLKYSIPFLLGVIVAAIFSVFAFYGTLDNFRMEAYEHGFGVWRFEPGKPQRFQWLDDFIKEEHKELWKAGDTKYATPPPKRL